MSSTKDSSLGHGTNGSPQSNIEEQTYPSQAAENEQAATNPPKYDPSPKHESRYGWGSNNPIKDHTEGQQLLDTGYQSGKQIYNITNEGVIVKFQPDNTPGNGFHPYEVSKTRDIPATILKKMLADGKITHSDYNRWRKGKK